MPGKLDTLEKRIIGELYANSRMPLSMLAKKLRISKQRLNYRIEKLCRDGSIKGFVLLVDRARIGMLRFSMACSITPFSAAQEKRVMRSLLALNPTLLFRCEGQWNLFVSFLLPDTYAMADAASQVRVLLRGHILSEELFVQMHSQNYRVSSEERFRPVHVFGEQAKTVEIDEKDRRVLAALSINARASYLELSKILRMPPETIRYRIKRLEREKVIIGYAISLDPNLDGLHYYRVFVKLASPTPEEIKKVTDYIASLPQATRVVTLVSKYDLFYDATVAHGDELRRIRADIERRFFKSIVAQDAMRVYDELRFCFYPPLQK